MEILKVSISIETSRRPAESEVIIHRGVGRPKQNQLEHISTHLNPKLRKLREKNVIAMFFFIFSVPFQLL